MSFKKVLPLSSGSSIPQIGLGTWLSNPGEVKTAVGPSHLLLGVMAGVKREEHRLKSR
jgi:diketogulonate reductase-like aldo/keto reductase